MNSVKAGWWPSCSHPTGPVGHVAAQVPLKEAWTVAGLLARRIPYSGWGAVTVMVAQLSGTIEES